MSTWDNVQQRKLCDKFRLCANKQWITTGKKSASSHALWGFAADLLNTPYEKWHDKKVVGFLIVWWFWTHAAIEEL